MTKEKFDNCCMPSAVRTASHVANPAQVRAGHYGPEEASAPIPGGTGLVGTNSPCIADDGEYPLRKRRIAGFRMGKACVTNAEFAQFVSATGYVTEAERIGWSFVFWTQVPAHMGDTPAVSGARWWRRVNGANWRNISGPGCSGSWHADHPVVQVSWNDAQQFAAWAGGRLPTEAEWEHAARGGLGDVRFPWGDQEPDETRFLPCNIWQGEFPDKNTCADGYATTAPAVSFAPNGLGLYNMVGNVWEWTSEHYKINSLKKQIRSRLAGMKGYRLAKGGSFLCHSSYCYRYRIAARSGSSADSATPHIGFRVLWRNENP